IAYDTTFSYELAVIIQNGMKRMYQDNESVFYYITLMNENYEHPPMPEGVEEGIIRGMYLLDSGTGHGPRVRLLGRGTVLSEVRAAGELLQEDFGVVSDGWRVTSANALAREGTNFPRWHMLQP